MSKSKNMENTAHSYTEAGEYNPEHATAKQPKKNSLFELYMNKIDVSMALSKLIELHDREAAGDETITMKEWNAAIAAGKEVLNNL